jgi:hypothetical protein
MSDISYKTLIRILDGIREKAPDTDEFARYHSKQTQAINFTRGQAYIHLFLLARFGVVDFKTRYALITDGSGDGGVDAYYLDRNIQTLFLIQSKFKASENAFETSVVSADEMLKMELSRITRGVRLDSDGHDFNPKILDLQNKYTEASRTAVFCSKVISLANLATVNDEHIRRLTEGLDYEIFDSRRTYLELVKPVCSGTYFDPKQMVIEINVSEKTEPQLRQTIQTSYGKVDISAVLVPTKEIGKIMSEYKNAILRFNPRNYLGVSKNPVNEQIRNSILAPSLNKYNDFALLNNGITVIADKKEFSTQTGSENLGRLILTNPQIINGGQTAYTLSEIYQEKGQDSSVFDGKEVLLRIIVPLPVEFSGTEQEKKRIHLIESVSNATNFQTSIDEADRRSNSIAFKLAQDKLFEKYGYLLEVKRGEYFDGLQMEYVTKQMIIDRTDMFRCLIAFKDGKPNLARGLNKSDMFSSEFFNSHFETPLQQDTDGICADIFYSYRLRAHLFESEKSKDSTVDYGYSLRYGKYAVLYAVSLHMKDGVRKNLFQKTVQEIEDNIRTEAKAVLKKWKKFEESVPKYEHNKIYLDIESGSLNYVNYYKGQTLNSDLEAFFRNRPYSK